MNKTKGFAFLLGTCLLLGSLSACSNEEPADIQTITQTVTVDYGTHISDYATTLLAWALIPNEIEEKLDTPLIAGDEVTISFTGDWMVLETYPGRIVMDNIEIHGVEVAHLPIVECEIQNTENEGNTLAPTNPETVFSSLQTTNVIHENASFQTLDSLPIGTKVYAVDKDGDALAFYSYNPLAK